MKTFKKTTIFLGILFLIFPLFVWHHEVNFGMSITFLMSGLFLIIYGLFNEDKEI
jgi:hypothetical membrane protein